MKINGVYSYLITREPNIRNYKIELEGNYEYFNKQTSTI